MPSNDDFVVETMKIAADTQPTLLEALEESDPTLFIRVRDGLMNKYTWGNFAHALEILAQMRKFLTKEYGLGWPEWEPEVLIKFVEETFGKVNDLTKNKIWALQSALTTDAPWQDFDIFENCILSWCNESPIFGVIQPMDLHELAFGIGILDSIRTEVYSDEVLGYIAATLLNNGVLGTPIDVPLPNVNMIMERSLSEEHRAIRDIALQQWAKGFRSRSEPQDIVEQQLLNYQMILDWYNAGRFYEPVKEPK